MFSSPFCQFWVFTAMPALCALLSFLCQRYALCSHSFVSALRFAFLCASAMRFPIPRRECRSRQHAACRMYLFFEPIGTSFPHSFGTSLPPLPVFTFAGLLRFYDIINFSLCQRSALCFYLCASAMRCAPIPLPALCALLSFP